MVLHWAFASYTRKRGIKDRPRPGSHYREQQFTCVGLQYGDSFSGYVYHKRTISLEIRHHLTPCI